MNLRERVPKASVIVLVWNGHDYLKDCLNAVFSQEYVDFEVIVVDNGSTDGSVDLVAEDFPQARLICNERNLGFAAGNNVGLEAATGDVLILLNQDTVVQPGWLAALVETLSADPSIGVAGGKALYPDGTIQHAGGYVNERGEGFHYGYREEDDGQFDQMRDVDYVTGATLAITRRAYTAIDGLDEGFVPAYYEDVDWCYQARKAGFRVVYVPQAELVHIEASAVADMSHERMYLPHRNRLRFVLKHWPLDRLVDEFVPAERAWLEALGDWGERLISAMHHAYLYHLLHMADVLACRRELSCAPLEEADALAGALLSLRTVVPLQPVQIAPEPVVIEAELGSDAEIEEAIPTQTHQESILAQLAERWVIHEHQFSSNVPVLGPLIAAFRRQWNRISTKWYVLPMFQQQIAFNNLVVAMLTSLAQQGQMAEGRIHQVELDASQLEYGRRRLSEYVTENGRELAELAQEISKMRVSLEG